MRQIFPALVLLISATGLTAQSWDSLVATQWPGDAILKISEREFTAFMHQHLAALGDKPGAVRTFLTAQARAYGTSSQRFAVPTPLHATPGSGSDNQVAEAPEPNDDPATGAVPTPIALGDEGLGLIDAADDDWWEFSVVRDTDVSVFTSGGPGTALTDTVLRIYDANGIEVAYNDDYAGRGLYSQINETLTPGVYYAAVRAYGSTQSGTYVVDVAEFAPFEVPTVDEGPEPNDDPATGGTPTPTPCDVRGLGLVDPAGDVDWWEITLTATTTVSGGTGANNPNGSTISDTVLWLYDSAGVELAFDDDGGPGLYSLITESLAAGTYYFAVGGYSTRTGHYNLDVDCGSFPRPIVASYSISGAGCPGSNGLTPALSVQGPELPVIGSTFSVDCTDLQPGLPTVANLGFSLDIPGGIVAPLDLTPLGAPGCTLYSDSAVLYPMAVNLAGTSRFSLPIPLMLTLEGLPFYEQVLVLDPAANGLGLYTSDSLSGVLGRNL